MMIRPIVLAAVVSVPVAGLTASPPEQQPVPAGTRLIVRALTTAGEPVTDLKKEEISIRTDGKPREVKSLELVSAAAQSSSADPGGVPAASSLPPPFATNVATQPARASAREILFLLDEEGIGPGREDTIRNAVTQIMGALGPHDRVGLVSLRVGGIHVPPTAERKAQVTDALKKFVGGGSTGESSADMVCRGKRALGSLTEVFRSSPAGRTIVMLTPGLPATPAGMGRAGQSSELCQIRSNDLEELGTAAATSPANFYVLHYADGLAASANVSMAKDGIDNIAGAVNGETIRIGGGNEKTIARIPRETSSYYIATLDDSMSGPYRRIESRISRGDVKISARPTAVSTGTAPTSAKRLTPREMLATSASFNGVPLRATGLVSRQGTSDIKLVTFFEPADPSTKLTAASIGLLDEKGTTVKSQWTAKPEELQRAPVMAALPITPGKYRIRVAASTGTAEGTVDYDVVAALQDAPPVRFGGMMLGVTSEKGFAPRLQFLAEDKMAVGVAEVYGVSKGAQVTVQFELTESESAQPLGSAAGNVQNGPGEDARTVFGGFGIETLRPGDYIMRAIVSVDGKAAGTITRTLRKVK